MLESLIMMGLGAARFGIDRTGYETFTRTARWRWQPQARIARAPALQYLGPDVQEIALAGVIHPHFKGGLRQMEVLRTLADTGRPQMLVDGLGFIWQRWVILAVEEERTAFLPSGAPRHIGFTITLQSYGADAGGFAGLVGRLF